MWEKTKCPLPRCFGKIDSLELHIFSDETLVDLSLDIKIINHIDSEPYAKPYELIYILKAEV